MDDYYLVEEASDDEAANITSGDSEDDDFRSIYSEHVSESEDDDFDTEMSKEQTARMPSSNNLLERKSAKTSAGSDTITDSTKGVTNKDELTGIEGKDDGDEDLFYDKNADDEDQKWVDEQRSGHSKLTCLTAQGKQRQVRKCANSDAVLNCPGCMSLLSLDCQRHSVYKTQYRAMFVFNCDIDLDEKLEFQGSKKSARKKRPFKVGEEADKARSEVAVSSSCTSTGTMGNSNSQECQTGPSLGSLDGNGFYYNVKCSVCQTKIAVRDQDEVYHFFNVLASFS
jgi:hypothetical protein